MINYVFLGFLISEDNAKQLFSEDKFPAIQTYKFINKFVESLEMSNNCSIKYVSAQPTSLYPKNKRIFFKKKQYSIQISDKNVDVSEISFINFSIFRIITRFLNSFFSLIKILRQNKDTRIGIIVYSVHLPFMLTGVILSKLFKLQLIYLWTDPPSVSVSKNVLIKLMRKIEYIISKYLMNKGHRVIALTKYLAQDFATNKPNLIIEGFIDSDDSRFSNSDNSYLCQDEIIITYTGSIVKNYGLNELVTAVSELDDKYRIKLNIYGRGDFEDDLIRLSKNSKKINYFGYLDFKEISKTQKKSDFLINTRSNDEYYSRYSFPSKILEYMMSGRPVITTFLDGMPEEYKNYLIIISDNNPETIKNKLIEISSLSLEDRYTIGQNARNFALTKTTKSQSKKISDFINCKK